MMWLTNKMRKMKQYDFNSTGIALCALLLLYFIFNISFADKSLLNRPKVQTFINHMVKDHHFDRTNLINIFKQVQIDNRILQYMNKPLEKSTWPTYQALFVNHWRIEHGLKFWKQHEALLQKAEKEYGVPASIIVATLGIETKYGKRMGDYRVIDSLSNIAFSSSSRAPFFRHELEQFLLLTREEHLDPLKVLGSYAGALGQPQFMPSSYRRFAVHFVKSDQIDLMHNTANAIGSIANYYHQSGWQSHEPVALSATISDAKRFKTYQTTSKKHFTLSEIEKFGIKPNQVNKGELKAKVITLPYHNQDKNEYWIGFHNFDVIKRYNASNLYAMSVYQLSQSIEALKGKSKHA